MDLYIQIIVVACLTGMTSLLAHRSAAVFHDGIRPILPQLIEGYMNRREAGSIAFGLSIGFVASVGISFTLKTGLLNAWLLFLPTDILGVLAINSLMAFGLGAIWGILILTCLLPVNQLLTALPVDVLGSLGELSSPVVSAFALFPLVARRPSGSYSMRRTSRASGSSSSTQPRTRSSTVLPLRSLSG